MKYYCEVSTLQIHAYRLYRPKFNSALLRQVGGSKLMMLWNRNAMEYACR